MSKADASNSITWRQKSPRRSGRTVVPRAMAFVAFGALIGAGSCHARPITVNIDCPCARCCDHHHGHDDARRTRRDPPSGGNDPVPFDVCVEPVADRYIAVMPGSSTCDDVTLVTSEWDGRNIFAAPDLPFSRYCVYTRIDGPPTPAATLQTEIGATRVDPDPSVVEPAAPAPSAADPLQAARISDALAEWDATPKRLRLTKTPYGRDNQPLVAIVDTAPSLKSPTRPTYWSAPVPHRHGLAMASVVDEVRCPPQRGPARDKCLERLFFVQAFPHPATATDGSVVEGHLGSPSSLAAAIDEATRLWPQIDSAARLVVNMSVGWDVNRGCGAQPDLPSRYATLLGGHPGPYYDDIHGAVQVAQIALLYASCRGALLVAASGNNRGRACEQTKPLAPAIWETLPAPTLVQCKGVFGPNHDFHPWGASSPLVVAVGGLDRDEKAIANTRRESVSGRALYADHIVTRVDDELATEPRTGTSLSTAAFSAIAAQTWTYCPTLGTGILGHLDMPDVADSITVDSAYMTSSSSVLRRPSAKRSLDVCLTSGSGFRNPYRTVTSPGHAEAIDAEIEAMVELKKASSVVTTSSYSTETSPPSPLSEPTCGGTAYLIDVSMPSETSPELQAELEPQPRFPICPSCAIVQNPGTTPSTSATFYLEIASEYNQPGYVVSGPSLTFTSGTGVIVVDLGDISGDGNLLGQSWVIPLENYWISSSQTLAAWLGVQSPPLKKATFSVRVHDGVSAQIVSDVVDIVPP